MGGCLVLRCCRVEAQVMTLCCWHRTQTDGGMPAASAAAAQQNGNGAVGTSRSVQNHVTAATAAAANAEAADLTQQKVAELQAALEAARSRAQQQEAEMKADRHKLQRLTVSTAHLSTSG